MSSESDPSGGSEPKCRLDVQAWYRRIYALCQSKLIARSDAEDATQETFSRALAKLDDLRTQEAIGGWLRSIACHVCVDLIRRNGRLHPSAEVPQRIASQDNELSRDEREHLAFLIGQLPEELREVLLLHYYEEMTYDAMAAWLGVARSTVNDRLSRARQLLKNRLLETEDVA